MLKFIFQLFAISLLLTVSTRSEEFSNILINGNERISDDTIIVFSELPENKFLDESSINDVLKNYINLDFSKMFPFKLKIKI